MWFVANCSSMLSVESMKGVAMIPALLLTTKKPSYLFGFDTILIIRVPDRNGDC